jgi:hypothetical protein
MAAATPAPVGIVALAGVDEVAAWRYVREVEGWIVALERFRLAIDKARALGTGASAEERDAMAAEARSAMEAVERIARSPDEDASWTASVDRALDEAKRARSWALARRLAELRSVLHELTVWRAEQLSA